MNTSPKKRQYILVGGWILTAAAAFAFGRLTNFLEAPITPPATASSGSVSGGGNGSASGRSEGVSGTTSGSSFSGIAEVQSGGPLTVNSVTGGQPMDEWLKKLMAQDDEFFRMRNFLKLVEAIDNPEDIKIALKVIGETGDGRGRGGPFGRRMSEYGMLMEKFTHLDPKGAMAFASTQERGEKFMAMSTAMRTWAKQDPAAALSWAQTEGANIQMDFGRGGPGGGGNDEGPKENFALLSAITQIAKTDIDKAMSAASGTEIGRMGNWVVDNLANEMIAQRGADAAKKALESMPEGAFRAQFTEELASKLADKDPAGTAQWAMTISDSAGKSRALQEAVDEWAKKDPTAAGKFLATLPASTETDPARERYAREVAPKDPQGALSWANTITDQERRDRAVSSTYVSWMRQDPEPAKQALAQSPLSEEVKTRITVQATDNRGGGNFRGFGGGGPGGGGRGR